MKEKLRQFMMGRYGVDSLNRFLLGAALVMIVLTWFVKGRMGSVLNLLAFWFLIWCYFRMFSRNHQKRYAENLKFMQYSGKVTVFFQKQKYYMEQRKTHHIYKCPTCRQKIRIPKGKGKICITCPKCHTEFVKRS